eukprot:11865857-Ditylum_brightwellii.AAC.1
MRQQWEKLENKENQESTQKIVDKIECDYATIDMSKKIVDNEDGKERNTAGKNQPQGEEDDKEASTKKKFPSHGGTGHQRSSSKLCKAGKLFSSCSKKPTSSPKK